MKSQTPSTTESEGCGRKRQIEGGDSDPEFKKTKIPIVDGGASDTDGQDQLIKLQKLGERLLDYRMGGRLIGRLFAFADGIEPVVQEEVNAATHILLFAAGVQYELVDFDADLQTGEAITFAGTEEYFRLSSPVEASALAGLADALRSMLDRPEVIEL